MKGKDFSITISGYMEKIFHSGENQSSIQVFFNIQCKLANASFYIGEEMLQSSLS